jgi:eukaryotic-like serine/threonine-protein kinase
MTPAPQSISKFQNLVINSGLVNQTQWNYVTRLARHRLTSDTDDDAESDSAPIDVSLQNALTPRYLAELLAEQGWVTRYQAEQLLSGRSRFFLGPYLITEFIGQGGMGQVFKAMHRFMDRECAVKVLPTAKSTAESVSGFMREIRMQAKLDHPHLVRAYDAGQDGNVHYLVTEYVPGMDLRRLVKQQGPMSINQASSIIMQASLGLQYAHDQGLIHRDVKPGNILVTPDGIAKVSDVGLAGFAADMFSDPRAGKVVGTADYLSPEQIKSPLQVNNVSDIYSLGCTLYYAVCGKVPFPGGDTKSKLNRHLNEAPRHPRRFTPSLSDEFVDIIADMMEKDSSRRTQTCAEVAARLEAWSNAAAVDPVDSWTPSPWTAPPPPAADMDMELPEVGSEISMETSRHDHAQANTSVRLGRSGPVDARHSETVPLPMANLSEVIDHIPPPTKTNEVSYGMIIGLTVAIVLPPTLLIGFILGYLFRG